MQMIGPAPASVLSPSAGVAMARHGGLDECDRLFAPSAGALRRAWACERYRQVRITFSWGHPTAFSRAWIADDRTRGALDPQRGTTSRRREEHVARAPKRLLSESAATAGVLPAHLTGYPNLRVAAISRYSPGSIRSP